MTRTVHSITVLLVALTCYLLAQGYDVTLTHYMNAHVTGAFRELWYYITRLGEAAIWFGFWGAIVGYYLVDAIRRFGGCPPLSSRELDEQPQSGVVNLVARDPFMHPGDGSMGPGYQDSPRSKAATHLGSGMTTKKLMGYVRLINKQLRTPLARHALFSLITLAVVGIGLNVAKLVFRRPRPKVFFAEHAGDYTSFEGWVTINSFPSGHSQTAWTAAVCLGMCWPRWWPVWVMMATITALSRFIIGAHYLSDVVGGSYFGIVCSVFMLKYLYKRYDAPREH